MVKDIVGEMQLVECRVCGDFDGSVCWACFIKTIANIAKAMSVKDTSEEKQLKLEPQKYCLNCGTEFTYLPKCPKCTDADRITWKTTLEEKSQ